MKRAWLLLLLVTLLAGCTGVFFQPHHIQVRTPDKLGLNYEDVYFESRDGIRLHGWFLPAEAPAQGTIFFLHGNAENISTHIGAVYWLPKQHFNVFIFDYRGYGLSEGAPSLPGAVGDVESAFTWLLSRKDIDPKRVVVFGQSLGGSLATYFTATTLHRADIKALVVESAFSSYRDITREKLASFWLTWPLQYPLSWTVDDEFSPIRVIGKVSPIPLLVIHGDADNIVPIAHGRRLYDAAGEPKEFWVVAGGNHIDAFRHTANRERFLSFLRTTLSK
jgi:fermentation-respiration switch protein FrsA (DUF1100 family)